MKQINASSHRTPIYRDVGFPFNSLSDAEQAFIDEGQFPQSSPHSIYTRYGNPTVRATEEALSDLEGSHWSMLTSSGMSAIDTALSAFQKGLQTGTWLFFSEIYGGTNIYIDEILRKTRGIQVERFTPQADSFNLNEFIEILERVKPDLLFFESISNPLLIVPDAREVIKLAKERGVRVIVDNTFGTPSLWRPLQDGADLVVHSATKYLAGHGNLTAGVVSGNDEALKKQALKYRKLTGCILSPDDAYRLGTQLITFEMRFQKHCENAMRIATFLRQNEHVSNVLYPGLPSHPTYEQAVDLFGDKGFGAMVTFELKGGRPACEAFVDAIHNDVPYVLTLGDAGSILLHISTVFGREKYPAEGMIRLSVGCEPYEKLEGSISKGLKSI